ncbi:MAG: sigma-70 family RNA polymerase sigma factor [Pirellulales bacterium]
MPEEGLQTTELLRRARRGDTAAVQRLLRDHRDRLRRMVALRLDRRLAARIDPSDIVQEALAEAVQKLPKYLSEEPIPFYPWLRRIAWEKLVKARLRHVSAQKRSVRREQSLAGFLSDESLVQLADQFVAPGTNPSQRLLQEELRHRVRTALQRLPPRDRELLVLRYLEQLSTNEATAALGISETAFLKRQMRAIVRLRKLLDDGRSQRGSE